MANRQAVLLGIDVGTTNVKSTAYTPEGRLLAVAARPLQVYHPRPGWGEYDPYELFDGAAETLRMVIDQLTDVQYAGVAVSSMAETAVALDAAGEPLRRAIAWHDGRTLEQARWWQDNVGSEAVYAECGLPILPIFGINKLMWMRQHESELYSRIARWLNVADYVAYRLSGEQATDFSLGSRLMAINLDRRAWSDVLCAAAGVDKRIFAPLVASGQQIGTTHQAAYEVTGIPVGTPVAAGGMDHPCGALAIGIRQPGEILDSMGTTESIFTVTAAPRLDAVMASSGYQQGIHVDADYVSCSGGLYTSGASVEWVKQVLNADDLSYTEFVDMAQTVRSGSDGLYFLPHLRLPSPPNYADSARAVFIGLTVSHTRQHLARAVLEGLGYEARYSLEGLEERLGFTTQRIIATGGGTRNALLMAIKASIYGRVVEIAELEEAGSQGAAMLAGVGGGVFATVAEAVDSMRTPTRTVAPMSDWHTGYDEGYRHVFRNLYPVVAPLHAVIAELEAQRPMPL